MRERSRTEYSLLNIFVGLGGYLLNTVLGFICRMVFVRCLSADYLGVSGLFTNVLSFPKTGNSFDCFLIQKDDKIEP